MAEAAAKEPSMEDILSSIRKIIADEESGSVAPDPAPATPAVAPPQQPAQRVAEPEQEYDLSPRASVAPEPKTLAQAAAEVNRQHAPAQSFTHEPAPEAVTPPTVSAAATQIAAADKAQDAPQQPAPQEASAGNGGAEAARLAGSLASIAETVKSRAAEDRGQFGQAPVVADEAPVPMASAAQSEPVSAPQRAEQVLQSAAKPIAQPEPSVHVEMADAIPAARKPAEVPVLQSAVAEPQAGVEADEEKAFKGALMSPSVDGAVASAFDRLKKSTLDDMDAKTEAILRPMLREWLDENLPNLVERLVREEIERVARGS